jgi:large subunit ribosomal protein L29
MAENTTKSMTDEQLVQSIRSKERELVAARFRHSSNQLENTATLRVIRKDIARLKTEVRSRELANGLHHGALLARHARGTAGAAAPAAADQAPAERGGFLKGIVDRLTGKE